MEEVQIVFDNKMLKRRERLVTLPKAGNRQQCWKVYLSFASGNFFRLISLCQLTFGLQDDGRSVVFISILSTGLQKVGRDN